MDNFNPFTLCGKVILITGASSGIGKSMAIECSKMGATLVITGRNEERLKETFQKLQGNGHQMVATDLSNIAQISKTWSDDNFSPFDGIVLNAGVNDKSPIKFISEKKIDHIFKINFYAPALLIQTILKNKKINDNASIIMISSVATNLAAISNALYAASKGAINSFMKVLALELSPRRIRVNCIQPGMVRTDILSKYALQEELESWEKTYPLGRFGQPEDIAFPVIYLLSDAAKWVTGSIFTIDGGITLK
ncbi:SDR family NAD(P)-dependent oxidoreductase [Treponema primitia]|uniref:SDR family NAD(P)-dependent oxidoreductase n=1 Tax=Treponema primitia TaxID=88058 RepID=UPI00056E61AA|nr:SDR family oxidoreductase [Treponema primitia]